MDTKRFWCYMVRTFSQVDDAHQRDAMEAQIRHFGQTPSQVLMEPHPVRLPPEVRYTYDTVPTVGSSNRCLAIACRPGLMLDQLWQTHVNMN